MEIDQYSFVICVCIVFSIGSLAEDQTASVFESLDFIMKKDRPRVSHTEVGKYFFQRKIWIIPLWWKVEPKIKLDNVCQKMSANAIRKLCEGLDSEIFGSRFDTKECKYKGSGRCTNVTVISRTWFLSTVVHSSNVPAHACVFESTVCRGKKIPFYIGHSYTEENSVLLYRKNSWNTNDEALEVFGIAHNV